MQVRQQLYSGSMLRFRRYARHLAPLLRPLRQLIARYEAEAGLESSEALLEEVLGGTAAAAVEQQQDEAERGEDECDGDGDNEEDEVVERQDAELDGRSSGGDSSPTSGGDRDEL